MAPRCAELCNLALTIVCSVPNLPGLSRRIARFRRLPRCRPCDSPEKHRRKCGDHIATGHDQAPKRLCLDFRETLPVQSQKLGLGHAAKHIEILRAMEKRIVILHENMANVARQGQLRGCIRLENNDLQSGQFEQTIRYNLQIAKPL